MLQILQDLSKKFLPSDHRMTVWNMKRGLRQTRMFECGKMPLPSSLKWTKSGSSEVMQLLCNIVVMLLKLMYIYMY